jgi:predicted acylesterase/phospholipase RssA
MIIKEVNGVFSGTLTTFVPQLGAVGFLYEKGFRFNELVGTSGGSITALFLAAGWDPLDIKEEVKKIPFETFADFDPCFPWTASLYKGALIQPELLKRVPRAFKDLKIPLSVVTTDEISMKSKVFSLRKTPGYDATLAVRGSMAFPGLFRPVHTKDENGVDVVLSDGGSCNNFALDYFGLGRDVIGFKLIADKSGSIKKLPWYLWPFKPILRRGLRLIGAMLDEIEREHVEDALYANTIKIHTKKNPLSFNHTPADIDDMYLEGYMAAKTWYDSRYSSE